MKTLSTLLIISFALLGFKSSKITSQDEVKIELQQREGVYLIYPGQKPDFEYEYVGTVDAGTFIKNWRASTLIEKLFKVYRKEGLKGDALIFTEDDLWKADVVKFKNNKPEKVTANTERQEGVFLIYPSQKPIQKYEYVKTIDAGTFIKNWRASTLIEKLLKIFRKEKFNADAIIFIEDDLWKADAIKFE
jgi:hypothetical protein